MFLKKIENWIKQSQQYFFTYKDGFFDLPYMSNNPDMMVKCFAKLPFNKHNINAKLLITDNPFLKGKLYYEQIEEGLWFFYGNVNYKTNVSYKLIFDNEIPIDYYTLSYNNSINRFAKVGLIIDDLCLNNISWTLFKPKGNIKNFHFKNNIVENLFVCFNDDWLEKNINNKNYSKSKFKEFIENKDKKFAVLATDINSNSTVVKKNIERFENDDRNIDLFKKDIETIILNFIQSFNKYEKASKIEKLSNKDLALGYKVENYLSSNLYAKFPKIDYLSSYFGVSPTKLKSIFKNIFQISLLQYFQQKQMKLAHELLSNKTISINEVSILFCYSNQSKFAQTFKKVNNVFPSEV